MQEEVRKEKCLTWARNLSKLIPEKILKEKVLDGTVPLDCVRDQLSQEIVAELEAKEELKSTQNMSQ